jgi:hypothetical protein
MTENPDIGAESSRHVTEKLMERLKAGGSITAFFEDNPSDFLPYSIQEIINPGIQGKKVTAASLIRESGINRRYYFEILSGRKRPTRNYVLRMLLALKLPVQDAQWILRASGYSQMYVRNKRDAVILYAFEHSLSVKECNEMLRNVEMELI